MTQRILIDASGLKVSKPAVDVAGASPADLQFTSDYSQIGFYTSGTFTITAGQSSIVSPYDYVTFGKTFAAPPYCMFYFIDGSDRYVLGLGSFYVRVILDTFATRAREIQGVVTTTKIKAYVFNSGSGGTYPPVQIAYDVMDFGQPA